MILNHCSPEYCHGGKHIFLSQMRSNQCQTFPTAVDNIRRRIFYPLQDNRKIPLLLLFLGSMFCPRLRNGTKTPSYLLLNISKHSYELTTWVILWESVSNPGTHRANNIFMSNYSWRKWSTHSVEMPKDSDTSHTCSLWFTNIIQ